MTESELRGNALLNALVSQRNAALDQCAALSADLMVANAKMKALEEKLKEAGSLTT